MLAEDIRRLILDSPLAGEVDTIMSFVRPAVRIRSYVLEDGEELPLGASRMAGCPDLPARLPWPQSGGRPIEFMAQIDLAEVASACELPDMLPAGWLAFFFDIERGGEGDMERSGTWQVLCFGGDAKSLKRVDYPGEPAERFNPCGVTFRREDCLPDPYDDIVDFEGWLSRHQDDYQELYRQIESQCDEPKHRIGGYPSLIQHGSEMGWPLLAQFDTDDEVGWSWVDEGRIYN